VSGKLTFVEGGSTNTYSAGDYFTRAALRYGVDAQVDFGKSPPRSLEGESFTWTPLSSRCARGGVPASLLVL